jgi:hypothetical protein
MHVIFLTYASFEHCELRTKKFYSKELETAETLAKEWLFEEISHYIYDSTNIKKEELENIFKTKELAYDLIRYIQYNSVVHVEIEYYSHD